MAVKMVGNWAKRMVENWVAKKAVKWETVMAAWKA